MWQRALSGSGTGYVELTLTQNLVPNAYVDFTVPSSTYKAIMWRGNNQLQNVPFSYANSSGFSMGVLGSGDGTATVYNDSDFFTFPNSTTLRFTNPLTYNLGTGLKIFIMY